MELIEKIRKIDAEIRYLVDEINRLEGLLDIMGVDYTNVSRGNSKTPMEDKIVKLLDFRDKMKTLVLKQMKLRHKLWTMISGLPKQEMIDVVNYMILDHRNIVAVAEKLNYSTRTVSRILERTEILLEKREKDELYMKCVEKSMKTGTPMWELLLKYKWKEPN